MVVTPLRKSHGPANSLRPRSSTSAVRLVREREYLLHITTTGSATATRPPPVTSA